MAKMLNGSQPVPYTPPGQDDIPEDRRVTYSLRVPSYYDRAALRRACAARGAVYPPAARVFAAARDGIEAILPDSDDPDRASALVVLAEAEAAEAAEIAGESPDTGRANELARLNDILRQHFEPYAALLADRAYWMEIAPFEAARMFIVGWENVDVPFRRGLGGVPADLLDALPRGHILLVGFDILAMMRPTEAEAKNSESPSSSQSSPKTSTAARAPRRKTSSRQRTENPTPGPSQQ